MLPQAEYTMMPHHAMPENPLQEIFVWRKTKYKIWSIYLRLNRPFYFIATYIHCAFHTFAGRCPLNCSSNNYAYR